MSHNSDIILCFGFGFLYVENGTLQKVTKNGLVTWIL